MDTATARRNDPVQCFVAADKVNENLTKAQQYALDCIKAHPGNTAQELEIIVKCPKPGRIWKRCGELDAAGKIHRIYRPDRDGYLLYPKQNEFLF